MLRAWGTRGISSIPVSIFPGNFPAPAALSRRHKPLYRKAYVLRLACRANMYWEANLPRGFRRPPEGDIVGCKRFIEEKYRYECTSPASLA